MGETDGWSIIHEERRALAEDLAPLEEARWETPSLCAGWSVQQVVGHLTAIAKLTPTKFWLSLARAGFSMNRQTAKGMAVEARGTPAEVLTRFRQQLTATGHPPGPREAMVGEAVVHAEDIRRPLGIMHRYPPNVLVALAEFYSRYDLPSQTQSAKARIVRLNIRGLSMVATDIDWRTGEGPEVSGPILSLLLTITGRRAALDDLSGEGLTTLRTRV
jgi:uncharacterized protein (TIGR03083 family)